LERSEKLNMQRYLFPILLSLTLIIGAGQVFAHSGCTLIADLESLEILHEEGDCKVRHAPQSTFKIPLAVMGFETEILKDSQNPVWKFEGKYTPNRDVEKEDTSPIKWQTESIVWFSQKITTKMGNQKFANFIDSFDYRNKDVSGDQGLNNGLTHSWLSSSLKISPLEQVGFIRKLVNLDLPVSKSAQEKTLKILPQFTAEDWTVFGKTGTGYSRFKNGEMNKNSVFGWFVGYAEKENRQLVFAKYTIEKPQEGSYAGPRARDAFLKALPTIMNTDRRNEH
jgi:beta-lactamase class D